MCSHVRGIVLLSIIVLSSCIPQNSLKCVLAEPQLSIECVSQVSPADIDVDHVSMLLAQYCFHHRLFNKSEELLRRALELQPDLY
jgi:hypothetical protein